MVHLGAVENVALVQPEVESSSAAAVTIGELFAVAGATGAYFCQRRSSSEHGGATLGAMFLPTVGSHFHCLSQCLTFVFALLQCATLIVGYTWPQPEYSWRQP